MTFLDPIPGIIAAAIGLPALLAIYFLRLRRRALRVTSTLLWEQAVRDLQVNVPLRWLRVSMMLVLQVLALAALAMALARPVIPGDAPVSDRTVLVIDNSASMSARDGTKGTGGVDAVTRLDEAKRRAIELVRELSRRTTATGGRPAISVVTSAAAAAVILPPSESAAEIIDAIRAIEATDHPGGIDVAVELLESAHAAAAAAENDASASEEVVAFTDTPAAAALDQAPGWSLRLRRIMVGSGDSTGPAVNTGLVAFSVSRDAERPELIRLFARIVSTAGALSPPREVPVRVMFNDRLVTVRRCALAASEETGTASRGRAGSEATLALEFEERGGGVVLAVIDAAAAEPGDALDADNAAAALIGPVRPPSVLMVVPDEVAAEGSNAVAPTADPFLAGFFESIRPRLLRIVSASAFGNELQAAAAERRTAFREFNLVVFDRVTPGPGAVPAQPSLSFGAGLPLPGLGLSDAVPRRRTIRFDSWRRGHPLMRYVALDPIVISPAPPPIDASGSNPGVVTLAAGPDGPLIAALQEPGAPQRDATGGGSLRRVVVAFPLVHSNWGPDTSFAVFMANAVDLLTSAGSASEGQWFKAGRPITVRTDGTGPVRLRGPAGVLSTVPADGPPPAAGEVVTLGIPARVGVYALQSSEQEAACVNLLDEGETRLGSDPVGTPVAAARTATGTLRPGTRAEGRREVWHWFVLAAVALATLEWLFYAVSARTEIRVHRTSGQIP